MWSFLPKDSCNPGSERFIRLIYTPQDTVILTKVVKFKCDSCQTLISSVKQPDNGNNEHKTLVLIQINLE
ncbi:MAG: hypothetical protein NT007_03350 [Candidatus Kapabacteria bacterium]|nr:hypothetical protein [Candidatus Kapabacteria bacterium]